MLCRLVKIVIPFGFCIMTTTDSFATVSAGGWNMSFALVKSNNSQSKVDQLTFESGTLSLVYTPQEPPLGMVSGKSVLIDGTPYFITGWANGPATILFRVFNPEINGAKPICEVASLSESAALRRSKSGIEISAVVKDGQSRTWLQCGKSR